LVLTSSDECAPPPPPAYSADPTSAFYVLALEVYNTNLHLTGEQQTIALYWADNPGATGTPPGHWIAIVGQLARNNGLSLMAAAEAYARVGLAVADAFIGCWQTKYTYNLLRPVTYIQDVIVPTGCPSWSPRTSPRIPPATPPSRAQPPQSSPTCSAWSRSPTPCSPIMV
jgi:hypothetical protein